MSHCLRWYVFGGEDVSFARGCLLTSGKPTLKMPCSLDFGTAQAKSLRKETHAGTDRRSAGETNRSSSGACWSRGDRNSTHASWSLEPLKEPVRTRVTFRKLATLRDVIARLDEFEDAETIFVESATPTARAVVVAEAADGSPPSAAVGLRYLLEVALAREAIEVWRAWRPGRTPSLEDKLAAVTYYAEHDAWLPVD